MLLSNFEIFGNRSKLWSTVVVIHVDISTAHVEATLQKLATSSEHMTYSYTILVIINIISDVHEKLDQTFYQLFLIQAKSQPATKWKWYQTCATFLWISIWLSTYGLVRINRYAFINIMLWVFLIKYRKYGTEDVWHNSISSNAALETLCKEAKFVDDSLFRNQFTKLRSFVFW